MFVPAHLLHAIGDVAITQHPDATERERRAGEVAKRASSKRASAAKRAEAASQRPKVPDSLLEHLRDVLREAVDRLPGVGQRKMLVSVGWTVNDRVFALVSRDGRIVVRLPDEEARRELEALGAKTWTFGSRAPRDWLVLPETMHDDTDLLRTWVKRAWQIGRDASGPAARTGTRTKVRRARAR